MHPDIIEGFLHLLYKIAHILLIDKYGLAEEPALCVRRSALNNVKIQITVDILLNIEKICPVILDESG